MAFVTGGDFDDSLYKVYKEMTPGSNACGKSRRDTGCKKLTSKCLKHRGKTMKIYESISKYIYVYCGNGVPIYVIYVTYITYIGSKKGKYT